MTLAKKAGSMASPLRTLADGPCRTETVVEPSAEARLSLAYRSEATIKVSTKSIAIPATLLHAGL